MKLELLKQLVLKIFDGNQKNNTPSCIKYYMNKININCIHITILCVPKKPYS